jgi:glycosyltransferase involved in cell wall biosynthesis
MIRILHSLGALQHGGIETWLMHVMRHTDRERFRMDFLVHAAEPGAFDAEVRAMGSRIIVCRPTGLRRPWSYASYPRQLSSLLGQHGPYDIVHGHMQEFSGYVLRAAAKAGVPARIAHSHNCDGVGAWRSGRIRRAYNDVLRGWIDRYATVGLACSGDAARSLYGEQWQSQRRWRVLHYGIDISSFSEPIDAGGERRRWGLPMDSPVVGHVGRFVPQKNHAFLLEVIAACLRLRPEVRFLLVGDGPLRAAVQREAEERGLSKNVVFTGTRNDVPQLMRGVMDAFVFPSLWEGLPVALLEAQAAGLPIVVSANVPDEFAVLTQEIERLDLAAGPEPWARRVLLQLDRPRFPGAEALAGLGGSEFTIERSVRALEEVYTQAVASRVGKSVAPGMERGAKNFDCRRGRADVSLRVGRQAAGVFL